MRCTLYGCSDFVTLYDKTCLKQPLKKSPKVGFQYDYRLMQVKVLVNAQSALLSTCIKLPSVFKTFVFPIFKRPL